MSVFGAGAPLGRGTRVIFSNSHWPIDDLTGIAFRHKLMSSKPKKKEPSPEVIAAAQRTALLIETAPTLLEGACMANDYLRPLSENDNAQLAQIAADGKLQAVFALNVPTAVFDPLAGTFGR